MPLYHYCHIHLWLSKSYSLKNQPRPSHLHFFVQRRCKTHTHTFTQIHNRKNDSQLKFTILQQTILSFCCLDCFFRFWNIKRQTQYPQYTCLYFVVLLFATVSSSSSCFLYLCVCVCALAVFYLVVMLVWFIRKLQNTRRCSLVWPEECICTESYGGTKMKNTTSQMQKKNKNSVQISYFL